MKGNVSSDDDLASFEGKYPKDLFNKTVNAEGRSLGRVVRETEDQIVVFGPSNTSFDIPKSIIALSGATVIVNEGAALQPASALRS